MKPSPTYPSATPIQAQAHAPIANRNRQGWIDQAIETVLILAIAITPLLFTPLSRELFEFPKMIWVYALAIVGLALIIIKAYYQRHVTLIYHPFNRPLLIYGLAFTVSTILSLNLYTSIMGYYSRFNGGLASFAAYGVLLYLVIIYLQPTDTYKLRLNKLTWSWVITSVIVSIWGIAEHFGYSPSCWLLRGELNATCWVQDVQARVFATFGQPNWLAAYLITSIPLSLSLLVTSPQRTFKAIAWLGAVSGYGALWYSYSRSGWIGLAAALIILIPWAWKLNYRQLWPWLGSIIIACGLISLSSVQGATQRAATTLESGNFDSSTGQIRLLVWEGSLQTAPDFPLFGSGPETFPYSFLSHRPQELNQTTEWNFLYNKAHNEVLQVLVTTGVIGLAAWLFLYLKLAQIAWRQGLLSLNSKRLTLDRAVPASLFAGIVGVFMAQLLGFAVVVTTLYFWLAAAIIISPLATTTQLKLTERLKTLTVASGSVLVAILGIGLLSYIGAELIASQAYNSSRRNPWRAEQQLSLATQLNPFEVTYQQQHALTLAYLGQIASNSQDAQQYAKQANQVAQHAYQLNPHHILNLKGLITVYQQLSTIDQKYLASAINLAQKSVTLDKTDANAQQTLGHLYLQAKLMPQALEAFNSVINLRPQAANSYLQRAAYYQQNNQLDLALQDIRLALKLEPANPDALDRLKNLTSQQPSLTK